MNGTAPRDEAPAPGAAAWSVADLADAVEALAAFATPWARAAAEALQERPAVARELARRRVWAVAAPVFDSSLAAGRTTREAAALTRRRLLALGLDAPHENTIRQTLLRQRIAARAAGIPAAACTDTASGSTVAAHHTEEGTE